MKTTTAPGLDRTSTNPAYLTGQVLAILGGIQDAAHADAEKTAFGFWSNNPTDPTLAIVNGHNRAMAWLRRIASTDQVTRDRLALELEEAMDRFEAPPARLQSLGEQGSVILGYHHWRAAARSTVSA